MKSYKKYLMEVLDNNSIEIDNVKIPFVFKNNEIFVADKKIADVINDEIHYVKDLYEDEIGELVYNNGLDILNKVNYFESYVEIKDIETYVDAEMDSSGDEYTYLAVEDYRIMWRDINVENVLSKETINEIVKRVEEILNSDYERKYVGTHRTY